MAAPRLVFVLAAMVLMPHPSYTVADNYETTFHDFLCGEELSIIRWTGTAEFVNEADSGSTAGSDDCWELAEQWEAEYHLPVSYMTWYPDPEPGCFAYYISEENEGTGLFALIEQDDEQNAWLFPSVTRSFMHCGVNGDGSCASDDDCDEGNICNTDGVCEGTCTAESDCGDGNFCNTNQAECQSCNGHLDDCSSNASCCADPAYPHCTKLLGANPGWKCRASE